MLEKYKNILTDKKEIYLRIKAFPNANQTKLEKIRVDNIAGQEVETLMIRIKATPEKNKANQELTKFLAKIFFVLESNVAIISGAGERIKLIKIKI